jgi:hypothetical protein
VNYALQQLEIRGSSLGSNILKIEVEDYAARFTYEVRTNEFWDPKSMFRTETDMSLEHAQLACKCGTSHLSNLGLNNLTILLFVSARVS